MKKIILPLVLVIFIAAPAHAWTWGGFKKDIENIFKGEKPLTNAEVIRGLRQALKLGSQNAGKQASRLNGFYRNRAIFIPFPPEAQKVKNTAIKLGMEKQVKDFVRTLNRAAEEAAKEAAPIFLQAIKEITIKDGFDILKGRDDEATRYLQRKTTRPLTTQFSPIVKRAIDKVRVTRYWNPIVTRYNQIPTVEKQNPDLDKYVTEKALSGLFYLVSQEEKKIRENPAARVTDLLKRVFGSLDK